MSDGEVELRMLAFAPQNAIIAIKRRVAAFALNNRPSVMMTGFANRVVCLPPVRYMNRLFCLAHFARAHE